MASLTLLISAQVAHASIPQKSKVSENDATAGYLNGKLVAGTGITLTEGSDGGNETLTITNGLGSADGAAEFLYIEGSSADNVEQIIGSVDPTSSDKTFLFPNDSIAAGDVVVGSAANTAAYVGLADAEILIGDGSGAPAAVSISGDATIANTGAVTIANDAVALGTDTTGNYAATVADAGNSTVTVTGSGSESASITIDVIDVNCSNCIDGTDIQIGTPATGDIFYYDGTDIVALPKGTNGQYLKIGASIPTWDTPAGAGDMSEATYDVAGNGVVDAVDQIGTLTNTKWCSTDGTLIDCTEDAPVASTGDVESAGDCTSGACGDGSSDGGTYYRLYDGDSHYTQIASANVSGNITITLPGVTSTVSTLAGTETLTNKTLTSPKINEDVAVTATATEINYTDGVTSAIQTQLDTKDAVTTAGRSLTRSTNDFLADAELYTKSMTWSYPENPVDTDDSKSIWCNDTANAFTITKLKCESDQTVTMMLQVDDGTPADVDSVDLICVSTPDTDTSLDGDTEVAAGECVDIATTSVASAPTWASVTFTGTWND